MQMVVKERFIVLATIKAVNYTRRMCRDISEINEQKWLPETKDNISTTGHIRGRTLLCPPPPHTHM
jgi:hypothetical protein